jgi:ATP-dependent RNA helicase RhlE
MHHQDFHSLGLPAGILATIEKLGFHTPTPIQVAAIPPLLTGRDLLGSAETGTGKTAAFALPIITRFTANPVRRTPRSARALILAPTRELAIQIGEDFRRFSAGIRFSTAVVFGGVGQNPQVNALSGGVDVLVATPGRLLDLMGQGHISLTGLDTFVLDEADRMLDMGFIHDVKRVIATLPHKRHSMFFSATFPPEVLELANRLLTDPVHVSVAKSGTTAERIEQKVIYAENPEKYPLLEKLLGQDAEMTRALVFTRTKHGANKLAERLEKAGIGAAAIHGNKSQTARQKALEGFRAGTLRVLVATDIAARGIDIKEISHVINFELPNIPESYVHRIGRTARAGAGGSAISFCNSEERAYLRDIEKLIRQPVPVDGPIPPAISFTPTVQGGGGGRQPSNRAPRRPASGESRTQGASHGSRTPVSGFTGRNRRMAGSQGSRQR